MKRPRLWYLYTLNGHIISFGVCFADYSQHGSPEPQRNNKLKFPRLVFYNGFYLETEKQQKLFSYEDIKIIWDGFNGCSYVCEFYFLQQ